MATVTKLPATLQGKCGKPILNDFKVIRLLPGGEAVVSLKGLCGLDSQPSGWVMWEFVGREFAHEDVATNWRARYGEWIEAIDYETGKVLNFDNRGLSDAPRERRCQLTLAEKFYADQDSIKIQRKTYYRARGFKLVRLLPGPPKRPPEPVKLSKPARQQKRPFRSASKQKAP